MVNRALEVLQTLSADEKTRELAERRERALRDEATFLNEAKKAGKFEGKKETAARLLKMKLLTIEQIADATGLDVLEIEKLKSSGIESDDAS